MHPPIGVAGEDDEELKAGSCNFDFISEVPAMHSL